MVSLCLHQGFSICTFLEGLNFSALSCLKPFAEGNVGKSYLALWIASACLQLKHKKRASQESHYLFLSVLKHVISLHRSITNTCD